MAKKEKTSSQGAGGKAEVDAFLAQLEHPRKAEIEEIRAILLGASPEIAEGVKWNAPSFRRKEWFATFHLRPRDFVQLILHLGAKVQEDDARPAIGDPQSLLEWLGKDRATIKFHGPADVEEKREAFADLIRRWLVLVP